MELVQWINLFFGLGFLVILGFYLGAMLSWWRQRNVWMKKYGIVPFWLAVVALFVFVFILWMAFSDRASTFPPALVALYGFLGTALLYLMHLLPLAITIGAIVLRRRKKMPQTRASRLAFGALVCQVALYVVYVMTVFVMTPA